MSFDIILGMNTTPQPSSPSFKINNMKLRKEQNTVPIYDEDDLPDEQFYPEGLDDSNGPNAGAMSATGVGEILDTNILKQGIATRNDAFNKLIDDINYVIQHDNHPILLTGPTGAGKTNLVKKIYEVLIYKDKEVKDEKFQAVNCATLCGGLVESTLFGYKKGAFTGADEDRKGVLEAANGGLLFLDEIGELPLDTQAKLLKAIEEKSFCRVGDTTKKTFSFRLICGTNKNLEEEVKNNRFRRDLLERINTWSYRLPSLAERREDIEPNIDYEIIKLNERLDDKDGKNKLQYRFTTEAKQRFLEYAKKAPWEGNFREFHKMFIRMATYAKREDGNIKNITLNIVEQEIARNSKNSTPPQRIQEDPPINLKDFLDEGYETEYDPLDLYTLQHIIQVCKDSKTQKEAGEKLFKKNRSNYSDLMKKKLNQFSLTWEKIKHPKNHPIA